MKRFFNMLTRKYKDADSFIEAYNQLHNRIAITVDEYNEKIEKNEITRFHYSDVSLTGGLKTIYEELRSTGYQIDNVILGWIEKDENDEEWIGKYSAKLPKHTTIDFHSSMLLGENVEVESFPLFENEDIEKYASNLNNIFNRIQETENKIKKTTLFREQFVGKNFDLSRFDKILISHNDILKDLLFEFSQELSNTKIMIDKTLNFVSLPTKVEIKTIAIHAYLRKLVETGFLSHKKCYRRYVGNRPAIILPFFEAFGMYYVGESKTKTKEKKEEIEGSEFAC